MTWIYWLICFTVGIVPAWLLYRKDRTRQIPVKFLPALLRFSAIFLTAALLLAPAFPSTVKTEQKPLLIWLQDNSLSMNRSLEADSTLLRARTESLYARLSKRYDVRPFGFGTQLMTDSLFTYHQATTDISAALQSVKTHLIDRESGAIVLVSDGVYTAGADPAFLNLPPEIPVYTVGIGDSTPPTNAQVKRIYANKSVNLDDRFEILADLHFYKLNGEQAEVSLLQDGKVLSIQRLRVEKTVHPIQFDLLARPKGTHRYSVQISPMPGEVNTEDNQSDILIDVVEKASKVLILAAAPHPDIAALQASLRSSGQYKTSVVTGTLPQNWSSFDLIIAHQVPSLTGLQLPETQQPVWYILGAQSDLEAFSKVNPLFTASHQPGGNTVLPILSPGFTLFNLHRSLPAVLEKLPPLQTVTGPVQGKSSLQTLFTQQIGSVRTEYPLWVFSGADPAGSVLSGTGLWRWRMYEYKNFGTTEVFDELIAQAVHLLTLKAGQAPFRAFLRKNMLSDNERLELFAELRNESKELINGPPASLRIFDSSGQAIQIDFGREANYYKAEPGLLAPGTYRYEARVQFNGKDLIDEGSFEIRGVPLEYLRTHSDFDLLMRLSAQTGGRFFTLSEMAALEQALEAQDNLKTVIGEETRYTSLIDHRWLFFAILALISAEWLLRKYWNLHS